MISIIIFVAFAIVLFILLYDIYKTGSYKKPKQIILALVGALLLVSLLYTCQSDNQSVTVTPTSNRSLELYLFSHFIL